MDGDIQDCIDHLIVAENAETSERKRNFKTFYIEMDKQQLFENIKRKKSFLCVGLDTDIKKIPEHLLKEEDPDLRFQQSYHRRNSRLVHCLQAKPRFL